MREEEFIKQAEKTGIDNIQITKTLVKEESVNYLNEKKEANLLQSTSYQIKAEKNKRTVMIKSEYLDQSIMDKIWIKLKYIETANENDYLSDTKNNNKVENLTEINIKEILPKLEGILSRKNQHKKINKIELNYREQQRQIRIINNKGVDISTNSHLNIFYCDVVSTEAENSVMAHERVVASTENIDFEKVVTSLINETQIRLNEQEVKSGKYRVIFQNKIAGDLIDEIKIALNADQVQKGGSLYKDKIGTKIASSILNIVEDPTNKNYPGYTLFDNEGTRTYKKDVIRNGILKTYFHNNKTAMKEKRQSTGNEYGGIGTKNLYVEKGDKNLEELIKEMSTGIVITSFMCGQNSIELETGSISLQIFGYLVENGKIIGGIKPVILTTTFDELLNKLLAVGNDLTFVNTFAASPSLLFDSLSIAGE